MPPRPVLLAAAIGLLALAAYFEFAGSEPPRRQDEVQHSGRRAPIATDGQGRTGAVPGDFDYYALVLSWSPSFCEAEGRDRGEPQCGHGRGFVLHGLWPQYSGGYPLDCQTGSRPWVPADVIAAMLPIMPSKPLIIHEYRAHGTCSGLTPEAYFAAAAKLFRGVAIPERFQDVREDVLSSPDSVEQSFLSANPRLTPEMIAVSCRGRDLLDIRICYDKHFEPVSCGDNERQSRLCSRASIGIPAPAR